MHFFAYFFFFRQTIAKRMVGDGDSSSLTVTTAIMHVTSNGNANDLTMRYRDDDIGIFPICRQFWNFCPKMNAFRAKLTTSIMAAAVAAA